jgi:hypothetical protein
MVVPPPMQRVDREKTEKLLLYVCHKMGTYPGFGAIVLAKTLYYIDHAHYLKHGKKLTGMTYVKQRLGPTPAPAQFLPIRDRLILRGKLVEKTTDYFGKVQKRLCATSTPDVSVFSPEEVVVIDSVIEQLSGFDGKTISDVTHDELSWKLADMMEELPDYAYLLSDAPLTQKDLDWAHGALDEHSTSIRKRK